MLLKPISMHDLFFVRPNPSSFRPFATVLKNVVNWNSQHLLDVLTDDVHILSNDFDLANEFYAKDNSLQWTAITPAVIH